MQPAHVQPSSRHTPTIAYGSVLAEDDPGTELERRVGELMRHCARKFGATLLAAESAYALDLLIHAVVHDEAYLHMCMTLLDEITTLLQHQTPRASEAISEPSGSEWAYFLTEVYGPDWHNVEGASEAFVLSYEHMLQACMTHPDLLDRVEQHLQRLAPRPSRSFAKALKTARSTDACLMAMRCLVLRKREGGVLPCDDLPKWLLEAFFAHAQHHLAWLAAWTNQTPPDALSVPPIDVAQQIAQDQKFAAALARIEAQAASPQRSASTLSEDALDALEDAIPWLEGLA